MCASVLSTPGLPPPPHTPHPASSSAGRTPRRFARTPQPLNERRLSLRSSTLNLSLSDGTPPAGRARADTGSAVKRRVDEQHVSVASDNSYFDTSPKSWLLGHRSKRQRR
jgi:hypothetical protein